MPAPRKVAGRLRSTARRVAAIPDAAVQSAAEEAIVRARETGGGFSWGDLTARITSTSTRGGTARATVQGDPAGAWSIKSYGRQGGYLVRSRRGGPVDLRRWNRGPRAAWSSTPGRARGDDRWNRGVAEPVTDLFGDVARDLLREGVTNGR